MIATAVTPAYLPLAETLANSLRPFGVELTILPFDDRGSWIRNCCAKAVVAVNAWAKVWDRHALWLLDADMVALRDPRPSLFLGRFDLAVLWTQGECAPDARVITSVQGFAPTPCGRAAAESWSSLCEHPGRIKTPAPNGYLDQAAMVDVIEEITMHGAWVSYLEPFVAAKPEDGVRARDVVFRHQAASRDMRAQVDQR